MHFRQAVQTKQQGQVLVLFTMILMTLVFVLALLFNTGQQLHMRTKVQNTVDSAAISHGSNVARSLNMMSMNNVAITQSFTLQVLMVSLLPELIASSKETGQLIAEHFRGMLMYCNNWATAAKCGYHLSLFIEAWLIAFDIMDIWGDLGVSLNIFSNGGYSSSSLLPKKIFTAHDITRALESMNDNLAQGFNEESATMSKALATLNDMDEAPIYIADSAFGKIDDTKDHHGTNLPITRTTPFGAFFEPDGFNFSAAVQDFGLCATAYYGSPYKSIYTTFWNFQEHGYEIGEGPYKVGKDAFEAQIGPIVKNIESFPFYEDVANSTDFDKKIADKVFYAACIAQAMVSKNGSPLDRIELWRINKPYFFPSLGLGGSRDDWSILALARKEQWAGFISKSIFQNPVKAHYGYAQVEIYNSVWYDLYTQDWRAKLVPAQDISKLETEKVDLIKQYFPELAKALDHPIASETDRYNAH